VLESSPNSTVLDGVWWPHTWSLQREVPFLDVAIHDATHARIARLSYTVGSWDEDTTKIWTPLGMVKVGWFITSLHPSDVDLSLTDNRRVVLHVIAPSTSARDAQARLNTAEDSRSRNAPTMVRPDAHADPAARRGRRPPGGELRARCHRGRPAASGGKGRHPVKRPVRTRS
jgi:Family of unknown function (DUF5994)